MQVKFTGSIDRVTLPKGKGDMGYAQIFFKGGMLNIPFASGLGEQLKKLECQDAVITVEVKPKATVDFGRAETWFRPSSVVAVEAVKV